MAAIQDGLRLDLPEEVSEKAMVASEPPAAVNEQFPESMTERATKLETAIPRFAASARETSKTTPLTPAQVANAKKLDKLSQLRKWHYFEASCCFALGLKTLIGMC
ncbi:hypothetical protein CAPTEDRAFT_192279 [Capitella teleta]|uniref:Uncharacterized protein n=1 Tax=Capitella teleta TaxID=283909 RepID=R7U9Q1_CAPTE|nr:hypothetical protein CAPTEDRAFT_192279 [Capitella teleta]|eukprot:ELU03090.1 hypothetical protein CAPTEDRAFT_192279 [Capitella teleta]